MTGRYTIRLNGIDITPDFADGTRAELRVGPPPPDYRVISGTFEEVFARVGENERIEKLFCRSIRETLPKLFDGPLEFEIPDNIESALVEPPGCFSFEVVRNVYLAEGQVVLLVRDMMSDADVEKAADALAAVLPKEAP